ncbi:MAG: hypothetical protein LBU88_00245 [Treponema sp.]|jgi:hypothetical protein|nr:hypothetical protein [Treponema sp.]
MNKGAIVLPIKTAAAFVGAQLCELHKCDRPFMVKFSGKKNKKINGKYISSTEEIIIYEKNFISEEGQLNETMLMYTAIHELAHHIQFTEYGQTGSRSHTKLFYSILDDLIELAEKAGIYKPVIDAELQEMIDEAKKISCELAKLQRELGAVLVKLNDTCVNKGIRFEDIMHRKVRVSKETANKILKIQSINIPENYGIDIQEAIAGERDEYKQKAMAAVAKAGKSIYQIKRAGSSFSSGEKNSENEIDELIREKTRIEKTIETLSGRLREIMRKINNDAGLRVPCAADGRSGVYVSNAEE